MAVGVPTTRASEPDPCSQLSIVAPSDATLPWGKPVH
jgi:hypothetical protein